MNRAVKLICIALFLPLLCSSSFAQEINYTVEFNGLDDAKTLKAIKSAAQLIALKKTHPAASINALHYRAQSDIPEFIKVLHGYGYYEAQVNFQIQDTQDKVRVLIYIEPGPRYHIEEFLISLYCNTLDQPSDCCPIALEDIGITTGKPALSQTIVNAELSLLHILAECGFPLAHIEERSFIVDAQSKSMRVHLFVKTGEKTHFGPLTITGLNKVKPEYIQHKKNWKEGEVYDSRLVEETQTTLLNSGLFSSILITHEDTLSASGEIPMKIEVSETKHRTINLGVSYQTVFGPGITFGWENRNIAGMGRKLSFQGDITRISQTGLATYLHQEFLRLDQDFIWQAQAAHESLFAYSMRSYNMIDRIDRRFNRHLRGAMGIRAERLYVTASVHNGDYWLLEFPLYFRYSTANSLLDPTRGATVEFTMTPTLNMPNTKDSYLVHELSENTHLSLTKNERIILAQQLTLGWLMSKDLNSVPLSKRFLGGSEQELRGYRYRTVSPLKEGKPQGGRSAVYFTVETRFRVSKKVGLVPFFDLGNVYNSIFPKIRGKWYKSTGLGLRYFSFMGPFRLDFAIPLDRRKGIDPLYRILVSIGQTF